VRLTSHARFGGEDGDTGREAPRPVLTQRGRPTAQARCPLLALCLWAAAHRGRSAACNYVAVHSLFEGDCPIMKFASTIAVLIALVFPITAMGQGSSTPSSKAIDFKKKIFRRTEKLLMPAEDALT
jgi:hypothetical protein